MNKERILEVADTIRNNSIDGLGFNMRNYFSDNYQDQSGHNCGTVACIAGYATYMYVDTYADKAVQDLTMFTSFIVKRVAQRALELTDDERAKLFAPVTTLVQTENWEDIPAHVAVEVLEMFAHTGIIDWDTPMEAHNA